MKPVELEIEGRDGAARTGWAVTARGRFRTPCFMPVGTRGTVRMLSAVDLEDLGAEVVLANTYHLLMRPGIETVRGAGGLHRFSGWNGHLLTDSGGYQVYSLRPAIDPDGVTFRSTYDGSLHRLTPEGAVAAQEAIGADIAMTLDVCPPLPSPASQIRTAVEITADWADRSRRTHTDPAQSLFGIVQGGVDPELRRESAQRTAAMGFDGYGIGGLSVGESRPEMLEALAGAVGALPEDRPRYLMGVGDPVGLVEAVALGVDMFDCVLPTRLGRHGTALTSGGRLAVRSARFRDDEVPLDPACGCAVCRRHSRAFLRHLLAVGEPAGGRLLSWHNLAWTLALMASAVRAVAAGELSSLRRQVADVWG